MGKKIGLNIGGRRFDVDVDDKFAVFLQSQMKKDFQIEGNNDARAVLHAYVRRTYELYQQQLEIDEILKKIEKGL